MLACATSHLDWMIALIDQLARLESPSTDPHLLHRCGVALAHVLSELGASVTTWPRGDGGDHLRAEFGHGRSQVLLLGHFDTVWSEGQIARMPVHRDEERIYGPGVYDMKAGIAIGLTAVRCLSELGRMPGHRIVMLLTCDEETGSASSRTLIETEAQRSRAVLVLEPALPGGALKTSRKGVGEFRIRACGVPAHAGIEPEKGASAIHELAWQLDKLTGLADSGRGIAINVGVFRGGERSNVVAESAYMDVDVRVETMRDAERISRAMAALAPRDVRVTLEVSGSMSRPPLERTPGVLELYGIAARVARECGQDLGEGATGGGSDGNFTAALGIPTLDGLGADGGGAHALHEHALIASLPFRAALVAGILTRLQ